MVTHTGEGKVTETEVGDEESYYEVEITLDDGSQVDVQLDRIVQNVVAAVSRTGVIGVSDPARAVNRIPHELDRRRGFRVSARGVGSMRWRST